LSIDQISKKIGYNKITIAAIINKKSVH